MPVYIRELNQVAESKSRDYCRKCFGRDYVLIERSGRQLARCARCGFLMPAREIKSCAFDTPTLLAAQN